MLIINDNDFTMIKIAMVSYLTLSKKSIFSLINNVATAFSTKIRIAYVIAAEDNFLQMTHCVKKT